MLITCDTTNQDSSRAYYNVKKSGMEIVDEAYKAQNLTGEVQNLKQIINYFKL